MNRFNNITKALGVYFLAAVAIRIITASLGESKGQTDGISSFVIMSLGSVPLTALIIMIEKSFTTKSLTRKIKDMGSAEELESQVVQVIELIETRLKKGTQIELDSFIGFHSSQYITRGELENYRKKNEFKESKFGRRKKKILENEVKKEVVMNINGDRGEDHSYLAETQTDNIWISFVLTKEELNQIDSHNQNSQNMAEKVNLAIKARDERYAVLRKNNIL